MKYILDDRVIYHPEAQTLTTCTEPVQVVKLTYPASCCLAALLLYAPEVVSRQQLMDDIRVCCADAIPTDNAFYQCISIIRRGLKLVGMENDVIRTIPRVGFCIAESVSILRREDDTGRVIPLMRRTDDALQGEARTPPLSGRFLTYAAITLALMVVVVEMLLLMKEVI